MRVTARGKTAFVKLEDKISGEKAADRAVSLFTGPAAVVNHFPFSVTHLFQGDPAHVQACCLFCSTQGYNLFLSDGDFQVLACLLSSRLNFYTAPFLKNH